MFLRIFFRLILSRHQRESRLGYVAEYCRICRTILPYEILEQNMAYHVCFVPVERGQFLRNVQICCGCRTEAACNIRQFTGFSRSADVPLESLIASTQPKVIEQNQENLAIAESLAAGPEKVDANLRRRLIREAFGTAEPQFSGGYGHHGLKILARMLRPLAPGEDEIRAALQLYRESNSRMGARLSVEEVMVAIYPETEVKDSNKFSY